jgi:hypothetical protein
MVKRTVLNFGAAQSGELGSESGIDVQRSSGA